MLIIPKADRITEPYWEGARNGRLLIQGCRACGHKWHPPTPICPACQVKDYAWEPVAGDGVVYSWTIVHHAAHVAVARQVPYLVALVTLREGPRIVANIVDCPMDDVHIGMPVTLTFRTIAPDVVLPQFTPAKVRA